MTPEERKRIEEDIEQSKLLVKKGIINDPDVLLQIYRMQVYYQEKLDNDEKL